MVSAVICESYTTGLDLQFWASWIWKICLFLLEKLEYCKIAFFFPPSLVNQNFMDWPKGKKIKRDQQWSWGGDSRDEVSEWWGESSLEHICSAPPFKSSLQSERKNLKNCGVRDLWKSYLNKHHLTISMIWPDPDRNGEISPQNAY